MTGATPNGMARLTAAVVFLGLGYYLTFEFAGNALLGFLYWAESLSDTPGLSGFVFLLASPFAFLGACFVAEWVVEGFRRAP